MEDLFEQITGRGRERTARGTRAPKRETRLEARALEDALGGYGGGRDYGLSTNFESGGANADSGWLDLDHEIAAESRFNGNRKSEMEFDDEARLDLPLDDEE